MPIRVGTQPILKMYAGPNYWFPTDLTNLTHYWKSDSGISLSGTDVTSWTDTIASETLTTWNTTTQPAYNATDASFNNQPTVEFDGVTDGLAKVITSGYGSTDDLTFIAIHAPAVTADTTYRMVGGDGVGGMEMLLNSALPGAANTFGMYHFGMGGSTGAVSTGVTYASQNVVVQITSLDQSTGTIYQYVDSSTPSTTTTGKNSTIAKGTWQFMIGGYGNAVSTQALFYPGKIMEFMAVKGVPTTEEIDNLVSYKNRVY